GPTAGLAPAEVGDDDPARGEGRVERAARVHAGEEDVGVADALRVAGGYDHAVGLDHDASAKAVGAGIDGDDAAAAEGRIGVPARIEAREPELVVAEGAHETADQDLPVGLQHGVAQNEAAGHAA